MTTDFKPSYVWPGSAFPFRLYFESDKCRIFIIENIQHNWEWMSKYASRFRENDIFFVYCGWYFDENFAIEAKKIFSILGLRTENFFFMFNSPEEQKIFEGHGFIGDQINHNAWLDESGQMIVRPDVTKLYDAIYVARRSAFKRHMLASKVKNLALVAGVNHGNDIAPVPDHIYINDKPLTPDGVCEKINQARCGLLLSAAEGACFSSSEYLLCGIPVVSTHCKGGRDVWYNEYNSITCEATEDAIVNAVDHFLSNPRDPERIRENHIELANVHRQCFISHLQAYFDHYGERNVTADQYFSDNYFHKMRKSLRPDFEEIFNRKSKIMSLGKKISNAFGKSPAKKNKEVLEQKPIEKPLERTLLVPGYIYSAALNTEHLEFFENQYLKFVDRYDDTIADTAGRKEMGRRIGYAYFSQLKSNWEKFSKSEVLPEIVTLGDEGFDWKFVKDSLNKESVVYGFGIGTNMSFEEEVANTIGCTVHCFDPTPQACEFAIPRAKENPNIAFHAIGAFSIDGIVQFYKPPEVGLGSLSATNITYSDISIDAPVKRIKTIMNGLKHEHIDLLKIDIEGSEHGVVQDMLFSGVEPDQVCIEFDMPTPPWTVEATIRRLLLADYKLIEVWGLNCLFVKKHLL